jgi:hypothetical protein
MVLTLKVCLAAFLSDDDICAYRLLPGTRQFLYRYPVTTGLVVSGLVCGLWVTSVEPATVLQRKA